MESLVIADTDVIIDFFADKPPLAGDVEDLLREGRLALSALSVFELYAGIVGTKRLRQIEILLENLPVLPLDLMAAAYAGKIYTDSKARGATVGNQDILIAGTCLANSLPLLTRNSPHFSKIKGLVLYGRS